MTKLLKGPYGWEGYGTAISIRCENALDWNRLDHVLLSYSCHPPALPKIRSALFHSGRYDCIVQSSWFRSQHVQLARELATIGASLHWKGTET